VVGDRFNFDLWVVALPVETFSVGASVDSQGLRGGRVSDFKAAVDFLFEFEFQQQRLKPVIEQLQLVAALDVYVFIELLRHRANVTHGVEES